MIRFEWSAPKATANLKKHGVSFEEAQTVFHDEFAIQFYDENHSIAEDRFILLGMSASARILVVCHCERSSGDIIRIISARRATKRESAFYGGEFHES
ncbi:MAG: BrnT family toxin [Holophagaceae bacterium]